MITNSQFKAITADYEKIQNKNRHILLQRKEEIYARIPAYQELEQQISSLCIMQGRKLLSGDKQALDDMKKQLHVLSAQKQQLLKEHGYPADYLDPVYDCPDCQDTGYLPNHSKCHCMKQKIAHYLYEQSGLENLLETENFSHLSKELLDAGYCVLYFSACSLFDRISEYTFGSKDRENLAQLYQDLYACDLLIIDDLGTELSNGFVASELFTILNERHLRKRSTIISSNISLEELSEHYSERLFSRITSNYELFKFTGSDIRIQKKLSGRK